MKMWQKIKRYFIPCLIPLLTGAISAWLTKDYMTGFVSPPFNLPAWLFPIVWSVLYILMGVSSGIVYYGYHRNRERALIIYFLQLVLNFSWSIIFFRFALYNAAAVVLSVMIVLITAMVLEFYKIDYLAGAINVPYLYWCFFALYLNIGVSFLNWILT